MFAEKSHMLFLRNRCLYHVYMNKIFLIFYSIIHISSNIRSPPVDMHVRNSENSKIQLISFHKKWKYLAWYFAKRFIQSELISEAHPPLC